MGQQSGSDQPAGVSPEATGGAGTVFEYRVAALALVALLAERHVPGLPTPVAAVSLQQRAAGRVVDDMTLHASIGGGPEVNYQVKKTAHPIPSSDGFKSAVRQFIQVIDERWDAVESGMLQLGLAAAEPVAGLLELKKLTTLAREHATAESFAAQLQVNVQRKEVRDRADYVRKSVADIIARPAESDEVAVRTHRMLSCLRVWIVEVADDGRDRLLALDHLYDICPDADGARAALSALAEVAEDVGVAGGLVTTPMLRAKLARMSIALDAIANHRVDLRMLADRSGSMLRARPDSLAGRMRLPRPTVRSEVDTAIDRGGIVVIGGEAGVGKSVVARNAIRDRQAAGATVVAIDCAGRADYTMAQLVADLGVDVAAVLPTAPTTSERIVLIDGAEHAIVDNGRLLTALMNAIPTNGEDAPAWTTVVTSRRDAVPLVTQHITRSTGLELLSVEVPPLGDDDIAAVVDEFPQLAALERHPRSKRLLTRLYVVELILRAPRVDPDQLLGEEDVLDHVWEQLIRGSDDRPRVQGHPDDRAQVCRRAAESVLINGTVGPLPSADGPSLAGLASDQVLIRDRTTYRFEHDVLADYAIAIRLLEDDGRVLLDSVASPRRFLRAVRLTFQRQLADALAAPTRDRTIATQWSAITEWADHLVAHDGSRWSDVPHEALLAMGQAGRVMNALNDQWLRGDGDVLGQLIDTTARKATTDRIDPRSGHLIIDVVAAAPVVELLADLGGAVSSRSTYPAVALTQRWLRAVTGDGRDVTEFFDEPVVLAGAVIAWAGDDPWGSRPEDAQAAAGFLAGHLPGSVDALFDRSIDRAEDLAVVVEDAQVAAVMAQHDPNLLLRLSGLYYMDSPLTLEPAETLSAPESETRSRGERVLGGGPSGRAIPRELREDGIRRHSRIARTLDDAFSARQFGPFAALLDAAPAHGLRLIGAVVDAATTARVRRDAEWGDSPFELTIAYSSERTDTFRGTGREWSWYRHAGSSGPPAVSSALLALRHWALEQTGNRPLRDVVDQVLHTGDSLAFVAVAVSVLISRLKNVVDELDPFLEHPRVWDLEAGRTATEGTPLAFPDPYEPQLRTPMDGICAQLVAAADSSRRADLKRIGDRLIARAASTAEIEHGESAYDSDTVLIARRRASTLDVDRYTVEPVDGQPGVYEVAAAPDDDVRDRLERTGEIARLRLELHAATNQAVEARDSEEHEIDVIALWHRTEDLVTRLAGLVHLDAVAHEPDSPNDTLAASAAVAVLAISRYSSSADPHTIRRMVTALLTSIDAERSDEGPLPLVNDRDVVYPWGADRSAAASLPALLHRPDLLDAAGIDAADVKRALMGLARSTPAETRRRLVNAFAHTLPSHCTTTADKDEHAFAVSVAIELVATSGLEWTDHPPRSVRIPEPLERHLDTSDLVLQVRPAGDGIRLLAILADLTCPHAARPQAVLGALIEHDLQMWPRHYARELYESDQWRPNLERYVAARILDDQPTLLHRYLEAFSPVAEELRGLLDALAQTATDEERSVVLLGLWPDIHRQLLPTARQVNAGDRSRPYKPHVDDLDRLLLPLPPDGTTWPAEQHLRLLVAWAASYPAQPRMADRLIRALAGYGSRAVFGPDSVQLILRVLGNDAALILNESNIAVVWLRAALLEHPSLTEDTKPILQRLVDQLATTGDAAATQLQRDLEV